MGEPAGKKAFTNYTPGSSFRVVAFKEETDPKVKTSMEKVTILRETVAETIANWPQATRDALAAEFHDGMYIEQQTHWDPKSDPLLSRIVGLMAKGLRAHPDSPYHKTHGAWMRTSSFPTPMVTHMEASLGRAQFLALKLKDNDITRSWGAVLDFLKTFSDWSTFYPVEDYELTGSQWRVKFAETLRGIPWRLAKSGAAPDGLESFATWFNTPMPAPTCVLALTDATLKYSPTINEHGGISDGEMKQIPKEADEECNQYIPIPLHYMPSEEDRQRKNTELDAAYAGNPGGRFKTMALECLGLLGLQTMQRICFIRG